MEQADEARPRLRERVAPRARRARGNNVAPLALKRPRSAALVGCALARIGAPVGIPVYASGAPPRDVGYTPCSTRSPTSFAILCEDAEQLAKVGGWLGGRAPRRSAQRPDLSRPREALSARPRLRRRAPGRAGRARRRPSARTHLHDDHQAPSATTGPPKGLRLCPAAALLGDGERRRPHASLLPRPASTARPLYHLPRTTTGGSVTPSSAPESDLRHRALADPLRVGEGASGRCARRSASERSARVYRDEDLRALVQSRFGEAASSEAEARRLVARRWAAGRASLRRTGAPILRRGLRAKLAGSPTSSSSPGTSRSEAIRALPLRGRHLKVVAGSSTAWRHMQRLRLMSADRMRLSTCRTFLRFPDRSDRRCRVQRSGLRRTGRIRFSSGLIFQGLPPGYRSGSRRYRQQQLAW